MNAFIVLREFLAVTQKTQASGPYGQGFNYWIEVGWPLSENLDVSEIRRKVQAILKTVDHRALGLDLELGFEPTTARLALWLGEKLSALEPRVKLKLLRGDDFQVSLTTY